MLVRLAFAVMIQVDADILLIDEVLAVGDAAFQQKCFDEFARIRASGRRSCSSRTTWAPSSASATARCCSSAGEVRRDRRPARRSGCRYLELNFAARRAMTRRRSGESDRVRRRPRRDRRGLVRGRGRRAAATVLPSGRPCTLRARVRFARTSTTRSSASCSRTTERRDRARRLNAVGRPAARPLRSRRRGDVPRRASTTCFRPAATTPRPAVAQPGSGVRLDRPARALRWSWWSPAASQTDAVVDLPYEIDARTQAATARRREVAR